ncbi:MAG: hypothetical protein R3B07_35665 [Polyangiaceae bacterium]
MKNASDGKSLRKAAQNSLRDGFTTCFFRQKDGVDQQGPRVCCKRTARAATYATSGMSARVPCSPTTCGLQFRAPGAFERVSDEVNQAPELALRIYDRDLDRTTKEDVPIAAEVLERARFLTVVLDEDPPAGLPKPAYDAGPDEPDETDEERIRRSQHFARVDLGPGRASSACLLTVRKRPVGSYQSAEARRPTCAPRPPKSASRIAVPWR